MSTILDFNLFIAKQSYYFAFDPSKYTILNAPEILIGDCLFIGQGLETAPGSIQIIIANQNTIVFTRQYNSMTNIFSPWITVNGGGGGSIDSIISSTLNVQITGNIADIELPIATTSKLGGVKPDGITTTINAQGVLSAQTGAGTNLGINVSSDIINLTSSTGTGITFPLSTASTAGAISALDNNTIDYLKSFVSVTSPGNNISQPGRNWYMNVSAPINIIGDAISMENTGIITIYNFGPSTTLYAYNNSSHTIQYSFSKIDNTTANNIILGNRQFVTLGFNQSIPGWAVLNQTQVDNGNGFIEQNLSADVNQVNMPLGTTLFICEIESITIPEANAIVVPYLKTGDPVIRYSLTTVTASPLLGTWRCSGSSRPWLSGTGGTTYYATMIRRVS